MSYFKLEMDPMNGKNIRKDKTKKKRNNCAQNLISNSNE